MSGALPLLPYVSSWRGRRQLYRTMSRRTNSSKMRCYEIWCLEKCRPTRDKL